MMKMAPRMIFQDVIFINCIIMYKDQDQTTTVIMLIEDQHDDMFCTDIVYTCLNLRQQTVNFGLIFISWPWAWLTVPVKLISSNYIGTK